MDEKDSPLILDTSLDSLSHLMCILRFKQRGIWMFIFPHYKSDNIFIIENGEVETDIKISFLVHQTGNNRKAQ